MAQSSDTTNFADNAVDSKEGFKVNGETVINSKGEVVGDGARLVSISQTFTLADFTDATTTGTAEFSVDIPVGAVVARTLIDDVTGFAGDTSATVTIGDGTDVDRYNTGTPTVFTTATAIDAGIPSGTVFHSVAKTPTIIVTTASDFTSVTAGAMTVTIFYYSNT